MSVQWPVAIRNAVLDAWRTAVGNSCTVKLWTGTQPATPPTADSGTLLATWTGDAACFTTAAASGAVGMTKGGAAVSSGNAYAATAAGTGTAGYYRIYNGATCEEQGAIGSDMTIDNSAVVSGQTVNITGFTKTAPGA